MRHRLDVLYWDDLSISSTVGTVKDGERNERSTAHHDIYFFLDFRQHGLVRDRDSFENMMSRSVYRGRCSDEIDMGEAA